MTKPLNSLDANKFVTLAEVAANFRRAGAVSVQLRLDDAKYCSDMVMLVVVVATKSRAEQMVRETTDAVEAKGIRVLGTVSEPAARGYDETHQVLSFYGATDPLAAA